ncbi:hypothetical protein ACMHYJ_06190 [Castellaniella hirudinis]|uniref:hypothetical protein n=1 Tax=Castellaniella hirudinis TaxID=1144617 RepID=UPI0039C23DCE
MHDITILPADLIRLLQTDLTRLDVHRLQELILGVDYEIAMLKKAKSQVDAALTKRYGEQAQTALAATGRDFGTAHLTDGDVAIKAELPKRVRWDQEKLAEIARRITAAGDTVEDFIDVKLSVSESRYNAWPPTLRDQFTPARTVEAGKPTFTLTSGED